MVSIQNSNRVLLARVALALGVLLCQLAPLAAQQEVPPASDAPGKRATLAESQDNLADKYRRLEDLIFKMADFEATSNPRRAALLRQAYKQSKDRLTHSQLLTITSLLQDKKYKRAIDGQQVAQKDLKDLLQLLLSEDRSDRLKDETQKIEDYIKELKRLERIQRGVRGRTEGASDPRDLADDQEKIANRTGDLAEQLEQDDTQSQDASGDASGQGQSGEPGEQEKQPGEQEKQDASQQESDDQKKPDGDAPKDDERPDAKQESGDQQESGDREQPSGDPQGDQKKQDGQQSGKPSPKEQGEQSESSEGQPSEQQEQSKTPPQSGQPQQSQQPDQSGEGQQGEQQQQPQPPQDENPAKKRVREAEEKMREAQQKLEEAKRSESVEKQTEALEKLQEAIAELEEILRQLREEEMERVLALLEGRFRKMLEMELKVYEGTLRIQKIDVSKRGRTIEIRASKLAFDQRKIAGEADRALTLLREEGSSVAFPEVVEQMRDDMEEVAARLDQVKVADITQGLEEEIIETLEELIEALQKAQQDLEEGEQQPPPGQPGQSGDPPLVDILAELKMIRSLQMRVNSRTRRYARLLDNPDDPVGQATEDDLRRAIGKLSELESRIQRITRDIALGKNQ